jgi:GntR family transcriptional regulator, transcriptional repressor for pyruvate dehydrogenase complex
LTDFPTTSTPTASGPASNAATAYNAGGASGRSWQAVLAHLEADLVTGRLKPGDHLAPERALATELGVGRSSVREAVRILEGLGLVRTQTGSGPSSGAIVIAKPRQGMSLLMRLQVAATGFPVADIVRTRLLLETSVAADLAARAGAVDLAEAVLLLDAMDDPQLAAGEYLALDAQFHLALADASDNQVVAAMMSGLRDSIESYVLEGAAGLPQWADTADRLRAEHRGIVQAIAAGDPAEASTRIHDHISGYYAESFADGDPSSSPTGRRP